ncbi:MAG: NAD-dependent epimerase/dehydratase family protein [Vulcanimicrobiota bacterium]
MREKVIVFGGSGFLGSHVADVLSNSGYEVIIYDRSRSPYINGNQKLIIGDILDEDAVNEAIKGCSLVYNFAGIADINEASQKPLNTVKINILGNSIILEAARNANIKRYIFASSLYVYSKAGSFYRSTKQSCELIIENYYEIFDLPYTILRYGSLYGPRSDSRNYIYTMLKQALTEGKITREGDGDEIREYVHIYDAARSSVDILSDEYLNKYVIITGDKQLKIKDLLTMIKEILNNKIDIEYIPTTSNLHYEITPYSFAPRIARKIMRNSYLDLGQGMLDCIQEIYKEIHPLPTFDGLMLDESSIAQEKP